MDGIPHFQREIDISEFLIPQITDTQQVHLIEVKGMERARVMPAGNFLHDLGDIGAESSVNEGRVHEYIQAKVMKPGISAGIELLKFSADGCKQMLRGAWGCWE